MTWEPAKLHICLSIEILYAVIYAIFIQLLVCKHCEKCCKYPQKPHRKKKGHQGAAVSRLKFLSEIAAMFMEQKISPFLIFLKDCTNYSPFCAFFNSTLNWHNTSFAFICGWIETSNSKCALFTHRPQRTESKCEFNLGVLNLYRWSSFTHEASFFLPSNTNMQKSLNLLKAV